MASNLHLRLEGWCTICWECDDFRALECGHCFCLKCLHTLYELHGKIECPLDRKEDKSLPANLPTPQEFRGKLFLQTITDDQEDTGDINHLLDDMVRRRKITIAQLRAVAKELEAHEFNCASAKVGGSVAGVVGCTIGLAGLGLSSTGIGSIVGVPLSLAGMGLATAGGITSGGAIVVESILKKQGMENVQNDLNKDYFRAQQIKILLSRAAVDPKLATKWKFRGFDIVHLGGLIARSAKLGLSATAGIRALSQAAMGIGRATTTTGLHITGLVFAAALIPLDIMQMIVSSIRIHKNKPSKVIQDVINVSDRLEKEMKIFLIDGGYLHLVHTVDNKWCYISVYASKMKDFELSNQCEMTLHEVKSFGDIIEEGDGPVIPDEKILQIHEEWNTFYHEYLANNI